jgi:hypothetical protein
MEERTPIPTVASITFNKQSRRPDKVWSSSFGLGEVLIHYRNMYLVTNRSYRPRTRTDPLVQTQQMKTNMRFGTWNITNHYRSGSVTEAARELARYKLDLLGVQKVRWDKGGTVRA